MTRRLALAALALLTVSTARAGIADSPLPVLVVGQKTVHLYSVPGVMNDAGTNLGTFFSCTSTSTSGQTVGVELFGAGGGSPLNNAATTAVSLAAGATVTYGTVSTLFTDQTLGNAILTKGSARILSTSKSLICTAFVAEAVNNTPNSGWELTITAKTKQKGD